MEKDLEQMIDQASGPNAMSIVKSLNLSPMMIFGSIIFGIVGFVLYKKGRNQQKMSFTAIGILLMIYPYFITDALKVWLVGSALTGFAYLVKDR